VRLVTLGVGAQNSPRYAPAGLLVAHGGVRVMIDGGPRAVAPARLDAWLVTDPRGELIAATHSLEEIRRHLGVESLGYLSLDGMRRAAGGDPGEFCDACFSGDYPTAIPGEALAEAHAG